MLFAVRRDDTVGNMLAHGPVEPVVFGHLVRTMMSVNVLPGLRVDEGQLKRRDTDYGAILVVEALDGLRQITRDYLARAPEIRCASKEGPREVSQGV
jgi:hypothetical protein